MPARDELKRLVEGLSEYECEHLLHLVGDVSDGERYWEGDLGHLYNEYVKLRYFSIVRRHLTDAAVPRPAQDADSFMPVPLVKDFSHADHVALPRPAGLPGTLAAALRGRRSQREYTGAAMSSERLSTVLHHACGVTGFAAAYGYPHLPLRAFPSSGGLQGPEVYLTVHAVDGIDPGLYHYDAPAHRLDRLRSGDLRQTVRTIAFEQPVDKSTVIFFITGAYERLRWKYGERAYRFICIDVGFVAENLYLTAGALGLGVCAMSGFADDLVEDLLGIDGKDEIALLLVSLGVTHSPGSAV
jgi:SagB-type dehydrogenase family enzyme